jgi:hypothetical protein
MARIALETHREVVHQPDTQTAAGGAQSTYGVLVALDSRPAKCKLNEPIGYGPLPTTSRNPNRTGGNSEQLEKLSTVEDHPLPFPEASATAGMCLSSVTRHAVVGGSLLCVTIHAVIHARADHGASQRPILLVDIPMARFAFDPGDCAVTAMREIDVVRYPVHLAPRDGHPLAYVINDLRLLRRLALRLLVAIRTDIDVGDRRPDAVDCVNVTVDAFSLHGLNVKSVIEIDGL